VRGLVLCSAALGLGACALALSSCGDTLQDRPIPHNSLESLVVAPYPVYWLGRSFEGLRITEATHDPSGAFTVQYGDCITGGQYTCVPPLRVVTSPDNSFIPRGSTAGSWGHLRGVRTFFARRGRVIELATGPVVVGIYAARARLAGAAGEGLVPINFPAAPGAPLPPRLPDTGFALRPLPSQIPSALKAVR
jgi:hypothetical protein